MLALGKICAVLRNGIATQKYPARTKKYAALPMEKRHTKTLQISLGNDVLVKNAGDFD